MKNDLDRFLRRQFSTLDNDGDGHVESYEPIDAICQLGYEFGHASESPPWTRLADLTKVWWEHLARVVGVDADGRISEEEYKTAFCKGLLETPESFDAVYTPFLSAMMDIIDEDHDGRLTVTDVIRYARSLMRIPEAEAREIFRRLDRDGDGFAIKEHLLEAMRAAYFDDSAESPRHWVLGPLDQPIELLSKNSGGGTQIPPPGVPEIEFHRRGWWGFELHCNEEAVNRIEQMREKLFNRIGRALPLTVRVAIHLWMRVRKKWLQAIMRTTGGVFGVRMLSPWPIPILLTPLPLFPSDWGNPGTGAPPPLPPPPPTEDTGLRWCMGDFQGNFNGRWSEEAMFPEGQASQDSPTLAEFRGRLYCTYIQQGSSLVHWTVYDPENGWKETPEIIAPNFAAATPVPPAMIVFGDRLYCFARTRDVHNPTAAMIGFSMFDGHQWSQLAYISVSTLNTAHTGNGLSAVVFRGEIYVFFRANTNMTTPTHLWYVRMIGDNQWQLPMRVANLVSSTGCAVVEHHDRLVCIYADNNANLMQTWFNGRDWSFAHQVLNHRTGGDPAIVSMEGQLFCIFRLSSSFNLRCVATSGNSESPPAINSPNGWPQMHSRANLPHESASGVGLAVYTDPHMLEDCEDFDTENRPTPQLMAVFRGTRITHG